MRDQSTLAGNERSNCFSANRHQAVGSTQLNDDDVRYIPLRSRFTKLDQMALPVELLAADFVVSMPKLKTHHWQG
jgi:uncharacterized protein (DUF362 family)